MQQAAICYNLDMTFTIVFMEEGHTRKELREASKIRSSVVNKQRNFHSETVSL
jgi:hypothetical protein